MSEERVPLRGVVSVTGTVQTCVEDSAKAVYLFVAIVALAPFSFGVAMGYTSPSLDEIVRVLNMSDAQKSLFSSFVNVGAIGGALGAGKLAEVIGRKWTISASCFFFIGGWLLTGLAQNFATIFSGRIIVGVGVGMVATVVPMYIAEISPNRLRGMLGATNQFSIVTGLTVIFAMGLGMNFRYLALVGGIVAGLLFVLCFFLPETPRHLLAKGKLDEAEKVLQRLRGPYYDISGEMSDMQENLRTNPAGGLKDLASPAMLIPLGIGCALMLLQQFCGINAVMFFAGEILKDAGMSNANASAIAVAGVQVVMTFVSVVLMDRAGRRVLLVISTSIIIVALVVLGVFFFELERGVTTLSWLALVSLLTYISGFGLGLGAIPWLIMGELFPAKVRGVAASIATVVNWGSAFTVTMTFAETRVALTNAGVFWMYAGICVLGIVFILAVVPETKGKSLDEIEAIFSGEKKTYGAIV